MDSKHDAYRKALAAEAEFNAAVAVQFPRERLGDVRYQSHRFNARTQAAADAFHAAAAAMHAA